MREKTNTFAQIKYGSIISYVLIILNIILGLVYTPWILHEVGSSNYGLYTLASSLISIFLLDFGMSAAVTRFIANFRAEGKQEAINSFAGLAIKFYALICVIVATVLIIVYYNVDTIYVNLTVEEISTFKIVFIITSVFLVACFPVNVCNGILDAYEQFIWLKSSDVLNKIGTVVVTIIALFNHGGIYALIFINGLCNFLTFLAKIVIVKRKTPVKVNFRKINEVSFKDIFSFSIWSTISGMSQQLVFNIIPSVLAAIANTMAITLYGFANVIEGYVSTITSAINGLFMPKVSRQVVHQDDASSVLPLMIKVGRINQSVVTILLIGLTVFGREFVNLWVGSEYNQLYYCILFLSWPYFISASQQIGNTSITVLNKVKYSAMIGVLSGVINIVLCYLLCPRFGVVGVCVGTGFIFLIRTVCYNIVYKRVLKIDIWKFFKGCQIKMLPAVVISFILSGILAKFWTNPYLGMRGWCLLAARALIVCIIYFLVMWIIGWNREEKKVIKSLLKIRR